MNWEYHKLRDDYTCSFHKNNFKVWVLVDSDFISIDIDNEDNLFSYGKRTPGGSHEEKKKFLENILNSYSFSSFEESCKYIIEELDKYEENK